MFYRNRRHMCQKCHNCSNMTFDECDMETKCQNPSNCCCEMDRDDCACGFDDEEFNVFPDKPMYGQSYVPFQIMNNVFKPDVGLKNGTIFPELVSPYCPGQSMEEIEYIKKTNHIRKGCNG